MNALRNNSTSDSHSTRPLHWRGHPLLFGDGRGERRLFSPSTIPPRPVRWGESRCQGWLFKLFTRLLLLSFGVALAQPATAATLTTDKPDYAPGQYVTFTGTGFGAGETVFIDVYETSVTPIYDEGYMTSIAD